MHPTGADTETAKITNTESLCRQSESALPPSAQCHNLLSPCPPHATLDKLLAASLQKGPSVRSDICYHQTPAMPCCWTCDLENGVHFHSIQATNSIWLLQTDWIVLKVRNMRCCSKYVKLLLLSDGQVWQVITERKWWLSGGLPSN